MIDMFLFFATIVQNYSLAYLGIKMFFVYMLQVLVMGEIHGELGFCMQWKSVRKICIIFWIELLATSYMVRERQG